MLDPGPPRPAVPEDLPGAPKEEEWVSKTEFERLRSAYKAMQDEHNLLKAGVVAELAKEWEHVESNFSLRRDGPNQALAEHRDRLRSLDIKSTETENFIAKIREQCDAMLHYVYLQASAKPTEASPP